MSLPPFQQGSRTMTYRGYEIIHDEDAAAFDLPPFFIEQADGFFAEFNTEGEARRFVDHITRDFAWCVS